jgi:hypothetical protein
MIPAILTHGELACADRPGHGRGVVDGSDLRESQGDKGHAADGLPVARPLAGRRSYPQSCCARRVPPDRVGLVTCVEARRRRSPRRRRSRVVAFLAVQALLGGLRSRCLRCGRVVPARQEGSIGSSAHEPDEPSRGLSGDRPRPTARAGWGERHGCLCGRRRGCRYRGDDRVQGPLSRYSSIMPRCRDHDAPAGVAAHR